MFINKNFLDINIQKGIKLMINLIIIRLNKTKNSLIMQLTKFLVHGETFLEIYVLFYIDNFKKY